MKQSDVAPQLQLFGEYINQTAKQMHITQREICAEVGISRTTYSDVWFGRQVSIMHYIRVYRYLYGEANEKQRARMDGVLVRLFH